MTEQELKVALKLARFSLAAGCLSRDSVIFTMQNDIKGAVELQAKLLKRDAVIRRLERWLKRQAKDQALHA